MRVFLSLGSNIGDRRTHLSTALSSLPDLVSVSSTYETDPVGGPQQGPFLNLIAELDTELDPRALLGICHRLESAAGRVRTEKWGSRTLDVDIIWIDGLTVDEPDLMIPHPRWKLRKFVLAPMRELAPDLVSAEDVTHAEGRVWPVEPVT